MRIVKLGEFSALATIFVFSGLVSPVYAAPEISSVVSEGSSTNDVKRVSVFGAGFGEKSQASPVLIDRVDVAYENGQLNDVYSNVTDSELVTRSSDSSESLWEKSSLGVSISTTRSPRHQTSDAHYYFEGENNFLGWPNAYGGAETPVDNKQIYLSWWYKPKFDPSSYWAFTDESVNGEFEEMETLLVEGGHEGTYIGVDSEGLINAEFPGLGSSSLKGKHLEGAKSGATAVFPSEFRGGSGSGFETPGSQKYLRIWEDPAGTEGFRFSWTQMHQIVSGRDGVKGVQNWDSKPLKASEWNHLEMELDTAKGRVELFINGDNFTGFDFDPSVDASGQWSPTIAALGLNGKVGKLQEGEIDDIYFDNTRQRVVLGDASEYKNLKNYEVQRPISWGKGEIELELFLGQFSGRGTLGGLYVYVFDKDGNVNSQGYEICEDCKAPPASTPLTVE